MKRVEYRWLVMAISVFVLMVLGLHFLRADLSPMHNFVSEYAIDDVFIQTGQQRWGWLMRIAFVAAMTVSGILAMATGRIEPDRTRLWGVLRLPHLFWLSAALTLLMMICTSNAKEDTSFQIEDFLHRIGVNGSFSCGIAAMAFTALRGNRFISGKYPGLSRTLALTGLLALGLHAWRLASPDRFWAGLTERILIGLFFLWAMVLAKALCAHSEVHAKPS